MIEEYLVKIRAEIKETIGWKNIKDKTGRIPEDHQAEALFEMKDRFSGGKRGHMIWIKQGLGKTLIVMSYLRYLKQVKALPRHIIYILPDSAIQSIIQEIQYFNFPVKLLWPAQKPIPENLQGIATKNIKPQSFTITLVEHDKFKRPEVMTELRKIIGQSIFVVDEVHKTLNDTLRTSMALELAHSSVDFIAMSGTMLIDEKIYKLINWLEQIVDFEINTKNFLVAANSMISKQVDTGIKTIHTNILAEFDQEEFDQYKNLVGPSLGGTNNARTDVNRAIELCISVATRQLVTEAIKLIRENNGIFIVANNNKHQEKIRDLLIDHGIKQDDIFLIGVMGSIKLTDKAVDDGDVHDYKVVITTKTRSLGYTLTRFNKMIACVYPSNNADREQLEGRINRLGQNAREVQYYTVHVGILTNLMNRYDGVRSLSQILKELATL